MSEKEDFINNMKSRTKQFAVDIILFLIVLKILRQLMLSITRSLNQQPQLEQITELHVKQDQRQSFSVKFV